MMLSSLGSTLRLSLAMPCRRVQSCMASSLSRKKRPNMGVTCRCRLSGKHMAHQLAEVALSAGRCQCRLPRDGGLASVQLVAWMAHHQRGLAGHAQRGPEGRREVVGQAHQRARHPQAPGPALDALNQPLARAVSDGVLVRHQAAHAGVQADCEGDHDRGCSPPAHTELQVSWLGYRSKPAACRLRSLSATG